MSEEKPSSDLDEFRNRSRAAGIFGQGAAPGTGIERIYKAGQMKAAMASDFASA